jgi:hypothetical protein
MKRFPISSALMMAGLLACGGSQSATTPSPPEAQPGATDQATNQATDQTPPEPAAEAPEPAAEAPAPEKAPEPELSPMHQGPSVFEGDAVGAWIAAVVAQQKKSKQQIKVRVPLVFASDGWGCMCPSSFIGNDPGSHAGGDTWITVDASALPEPDQKRMRGRDGDEAVAQDPEAPYQGAIFIVEGYFPGKRTRVDLRDKNKQPREWLYNTWNLRVTAVVDIAEPAEDLFVHSEQPVTVKTKAR